MADIVSGSILQFSIAFLAGALATFSPCILPAIPMVAASSLGVSRKGPIALALGLIASFTIVGSLLAIFGQSTGLNSEAIRKISAVFILFAGTVLLSDWLQDRLSNRFSGFASRANSAANHIPFSGLTGQFLIGTLLGAIWSPCTGPLLGAAIGLASSQESRTTGILLIFTFSMGTAVPILFLCYASSAWLKNRKGTLMKNSTRIKKGVGSALFVVGVLILIGYDRNVEAWFLDHLPERWFVWITHF